MLLHKAWWEGIWVNCDVNLQWVQGMQPHIPAHNTLQFLFMIRLVVAFSVLISKLEDMYLWHHNEQ